VWTDSTLADCASKFTIAQLGYRKKILKLAWLRHAPDSKKLSPQAKHGCAIALNLNGKCVDLKLYAPAKQRLAGCYAFA